MTRPCRARGLFRLEQVEEGAADRQHFRPVLQGHFGRLVHAAHNLALLRRLALGQLKAEPTLKVGIQSKRRRAGWDLAYLGKVMGWGI